MPREVETFRGDVVAALERMASIEANLSRAADVRGDEETGSMHEHGAVCLREAARAVEGMTGE